MTKKIVHLRYARLSAPAPTHAFAFRGEPHVLHFEVPGVQPGQGFLIERLKGDRYSDVSTPLLLGLDVFFGEDTVAPDQKVDSRFVYTRGTFVFDPPAFDRFVRTYERWPLKSHSKWKQELFRSALKYCAAGIRGGFEWMPFSLGYFGLGLECIGNFLYGSRSRYFTLGERRFLALLHNRVASFKRAPLTREQAKAFTRRVIQDVDLIHAIRNALYGHSRLHLRDDSKRLGKLLRDWYVRYGLSASFAQLSFRDARVHEAIGREAPALYKMGLRTTRLFLFMLLGYKSRIPFADHDFSLIGDMRPDEKLVWPDGKTVVRVRVEQGAKKQV